MAARKREEETEPQEIKIVESSLEDIMHNSMMPYSEYVIMDRALPRVEDGLKPVQRRILYSMLELGVTPDKPHRKSARIVGDCLGKYHPHGDRSIYDAMVRMAQDFNMRMTLVDGHGNYGSIDGDSAAAMRYTEARLTPLAMEMLRDLEKNTVEWQLNFDDTIKEPKILPSRFPNLLVNGSSGIAVGLATNIPPHNLGEVIEGAIAYIGNPKITLVQMMKIIKGPDFPTGGYIVGGEELFNAYLTGRGKIKIRSKIAVEVDAQGKKSIVITEMPYQVNKAVLLQKINEMREKRKEQFQGIQEIMDESDRNGMRAVIRLKKECDEKALIDNLFKYTDMEVTFGINMVALAGGKPRQMGLLEVLRYYVNYQREIVHNRTVFDLNAAKAREHILLGLIIAIRNIDEVIRIIRASKNQTEAKANLRAAFKLSEKQAQAIVDMRLGRLTKLEITKLEAEIAQIQKLIKELEFILKSEKNEFDVVVRELQEIKRIFKNERQSAFLTEGQLAQKIPVKDVNVKDEKEGYFVLHKDGSVKMVQARSFAQAGAGAEGLEASETVITAFKCNNIHNIAGFTNLGNFVEIEVDTLPEARLKSKGVQFAKLNRELLSGERLIAAFDKKDLLDQYLLFYSADGKVKKTSAAEYNLNKKYYQAVVLAEGVELLGVEIVRPDSSVLFVTKDGMALNAESTDIPSQGRRSAGVKGVQLSTGDTVVFAGQVDDEGELILISEKGFAKRVILAEIEVMKRYRKGIKVFAGADRQGKSVYFAAAVKQPYDLVAEYANGETVVCNSEDIAIASRTAKCKPIAKQIKEPLVAAAAHHIQKS